jgi:very-short-patch-repair endonuclease
MKLLDIISEDEYISVKQIGRPHIEEPKLKQKLIDSPNASGLTFDNVEIEVKQEGPYRRRYVKNYSCKKHPEWIGTEWRKYDDVKSGHSGCKICGKERLTGSNPELQKSNEELIQQLKSNSNVSGLTFDNVEIERREDPSSKWSKIFVKNYSCKKHNKWFRSDWVRYGDIQQGKNGCQICSIENNDILRSTVSDTWDGKLTDNDIFNNFMVKRNKDLQKYWVKKLKEIHKNKKYYYSKVIFNDPNTIKYFYDPVTEKIRNRERELEIVCPKHGSFFQYVSVHKRGSGCPICRESKGENYLSILFTNNKIKYVRGKDARFQGLIGKRVGLTCDFYLPDYKVIVEYDGEHHFKPIFGSTDNSRMSTYNTTYTNDTIRDNFAKSNKEGISLIRIPYTMKDDDINVQLFSTLKKMEPNKVFKLGEYPSRKKPKTILAKNQVDLNKPIVKLRRITETKLSLINTLYETN